MKQKIVRTDPDMRILEGSLSDLQRLAQVVTVDGHNEETLARQVADADIILTCYEPITAQVIGAAKRLKGVVKYGVGVDSIDVAAATERGIPVVHCPDYGSDTVADHCFALLMALARKVVFLNNTMKQQGWMWPETQYQGVDIKGKTIGIIGLGRIGTAMARRCQGFGMKIVAYDPYVDQNPTGWDDLKFVPLKELLACSDFIAPLCVLTEETDGMIGPEEFAIMKKTMFLIDVSRGAIVNKAALIEALEQGRIAGAGFDVFPDEPLQPDNPLLRMDNVIVTPHLAYYTREAWQRLERDTLAGVMALLEGRKPEHIKNPEYLKNDR
jgi:D-3-phosphoglycerate dehydrogenase